MKQPPDRIVAVFCQTCGVIVDATESGDGIITPDSECACPHPQKKCTKRINVRYQLVRRRP